MEALPYVRRWHGSTVVIKYGGAAQAAAELSEAVMEDLVLLQLVGVRVVLVHGGGKEVSDVGRRMGLEPRFVDGLRVTDVATMRMAQQVQVGGISRDIVASIGKRGGQAIGLSGQDCGGWLRGRRLEPRASRETGEAVDYGRVGDIARVDASVLQGLIDTGLIPVIAPVAVDEGFEALNVNADTVATAVAAALGAARLLFLTDVPGIKGPDGTVVPEVRAEALRGWIASGVVAGGMIPKAEACLDAVEAGVGRVTVCDGRVPHAVLIELLTNRGVGTMVSEG